MNRIAFFYLLFLVAVTCLAAVFTPTAFSVEQSVSALRERAQKEKQDGNFQDAYELFQRLALNGENNGELVGNDLTDGITCLRKLGRIKEFDTFVESVVETHPANWRLLATAAKSYLEMDFQGYMIAGQFERGPHRGGGRRVNAWQRDRARALQLLRNALPHIAQENDKHEAGEFYWQLAQALLYQRGFDEAWRLQYLTDLATPPDYEGGYRPSMPFQGAPVDAEGRPIFHHSVGSWEDAMSDGQRWRWALDQVVENAPDRRNQVLVHQASFYHHQFGVQTMRQWGLFALRRPDDEKKTSGTYALHTVDDDETIARLATGVQRFKLPDEFNFMKIYRKVIDEPKTGKVDFALQALAQIHENRRQYPRAAEYWRKSIQLSRKGRKQRHLDQIVDTWGRFEGVLTQPARRGATVEFIFRNGQKVRFTAHAIRMQKLLRDVKSYLKSNPRRLNWGQMNIGNIGHRIVQKNQQKYVGKKVADWDLDLKPHADHFDRRITVQTPLQQAGAYLLTAKMTDGNESKIIIWIADTALVKKQLSGKSLYFVADAVTGKLIPGANVEFFGYRQEQLGGNRYRTITSNFSERTDINGQIILDPRDLQSKMSWVAIARTEEGRFAYLGFRNVWNGQYHDANYKATKAFFITDRPVYRPDQTMQFKIWVRHVRYDMEDTSAFSNQSFQVEIVDPQGNKVLTDSYHSDEYGGIEGKLELPLDATLGQYHIRVVNISAQSSGGSFRVEEYKKPEFEVTVDAPLEPVMLGETVTAHIKARYFFGSPVTNAKVKYKVMRSMHSDHWYPVAPWDWCYGPGYWWFGYDYPWYPGWHQWVGCVRPEPWWWQGRQQPPEVVAEREVEIGPEGTVDILIDTAIAKQTHPDQDHRYTITAEVVDESRRTIVGTGTILVAQKPFKVFTWVDRGYYRVGDTVRASFLAQTLDRKPVAGSGVLELLKITYDKENQPIETTVQSWKLDTDEGGRTEQQLVASTKGQYRLSYELTDAADHTIDGGYLFTVIGEGFDGKDFRFNNLELIPDQREYTPGDRVQLQINTDRVGSTVLLFVRPANGIYLPPRVLKLDGKSTVEEIAVIKRDMPNFFVEAITISDGKIHSETKEIVVPPEKRVVDVEVIPSSETYLPGEEATIKLRLTDLDGEPTFGSTVVSIYDKSVEYISGGSNVPEIRQFFWKWRRRHQASTDSSLARHFQNMTLPKHVGMQNIGVFGATVAEELEGKDLLENISKPLSGRAWFRGERRKKYAAAALRSLNELDAAAPMEVAEDADDSLLFLNNAVAASSESDGTTLLVEPTVRTQFADTALWIGSLETDYLGEAQITINMPENLTSWQIRVWSLGHGSKVGEGLAEVVTRKNLIVRLQSPQFFVEKDEVVLSANVHNYLENQKSVEVTLDLPGAELEPLDDVTRFVTVDAGGEERVDWRVSVVREGLAVVRMSARTDEESDAVEMKFPSYVHGMLKTESWAGTVHPTDASQSVTLHVPSQRRVDQSQLEVRFSPTLAGAMVDALPYLADYPYGCTEQTLNRFLPTVMTQKILLEMNLDLEAIRLKRTNLNAQEIGDGRERAKQWKRFDSNPVFDEAEVERMVKEGVKRLTDMQNSDGGWGWFSGIHERSWPHTTAVVVHGLQVARDNGVTLVPGVLERGLHWLERYRDEQIRRIQNWGQRGKPQKKYADNLDAFVYLVLVDDDVKNDEMMGFLYRDRNELAVYSKAMLGLALHRQNENEKLSMILRNIKQYVVQDEENETAYLKLPANNYGWYWYGSEIEANAYYLKLLTRVDADGKTAPRLIKYLLNNRKHATYWHSTRDTAICVEAFADYLRAIEEMSPDMVVGIWIDGEHKKSVEITTANLFTFDNAFVLAGQSLENGSHDIEIRREGTGAVYFNAYLTNFTLEDYISRAGLEIKVNRKYYQLVPMEKMIKVAGDRGQALDQRVEKYQRVELANLSTLTSGDLIEVELEIESKNDYEYLIFEDMKPAGFEAVDVRSGYTPEGLRAYREMRDNRTSFFLRQLARGRHSVAYRLRAEIPGQFSALPARAYAMYAPELRGNSDEIKLIVKD